MSALSRLNPLNWFRRSPEIRRAEDPATGQPIPYPWHAKLRDQLRSRVIQGILIIGLAWGLNHFGYAVSHEQVRELFPMLDQLLEALPTILGIVGSILAWIGRVKATQIHRPDGPPIDASALLFSPFQIVAPQGFIAPQGGVGVPPAGSTSSDAPPRQRPVFTPPAPSTAAPIPPRPRVSCLPHPSPGAVRAPRSPFSRRDSAETPSPAKGGIQPAAALPFLPDVDPALRDVVIVSQLPAGAGAPTCPATSSGPRGEKPGVHLTVAPADGPSAAMPQADDAGESLPESFDAAWLGIIRRRAELHGVPIIEAARHAGEHRAYNGTLLGLASYLESVLPPILSSPPPTASPKLKRQRMKKSNALILIALALSAVSCENVNGRRKYVGPPIKGELTLRTGEKVAVTLYPDNPAPIVSPVIFQGPAKAPVVAP